MPDFNKDLTPKIVPTETEKIDYTQIAMKVPTRSIGVSSSDYSGTEDVMDRLKKASAASNPSDKGVFVTNAELDANKRFREFNPTIPNYEDFAAYGQSVADKAANGILKGVNLTATTIAGGFGMLYGAVKSPFTGRLADIWDNEVMRGLDEWNNKVDQEYLPNYYTEAEKNAEWYSTENWFKANFLFDKLIKNSGFAVGAMVSGNLANAALLRTGALLGRAAMAGATAAEASQAFKLFSPLLRNTARAFSAGKNIEAAAILESKVASVADLAAKTSELANIAKTTGQFARVSDAARRTAIAAYSSAGEASFEALQTSKEFRDSLIEEYVNTHGEEPKGQALQDINARAESVGKTSFFGNLALLGVTEFAQLPYLLGSSYKSTRQAANSFANRVDDVALRDGKYVAVPGATSRFGKVYEKAIGVGRFVFDPKEAGQELGQYALQVGTQNYFKKAAEDDSADVLVDGFLYGFVGKDKYGEGVGALVSKEGMESALLGGLTGGPMQAMGAFQEKKYKGENTKRFLSELNSTSTFRAAFKDRMDSVNRGVVLQQQHEAAVITGNELEARDLNADMMHNYLAPRIKYGRFDMILDDINELRQASTTEEGLAELKTQGIGNINDTRESFQKRLSQFETVAKNTNEIYNSLYIRYAGETTADGKRKYSPIVLDKMAYAASKIADYDLRIPQLNNILAGKGIIVGDVLEDVLKGKAPSRQATAEILNTINDLPTTSTVKDGLKTALQDIIDLGQRRRTFLDEYEDIKANPANYESDPEIEFGDKVEVPVELGKKKQEVEIGKEYSLAEPIRKDGASLVLAPKIKVVSQTLGGELEVELPGGKRTFVAPEDLKKYNITEEDNTSQEMADILDEAIDSVLSKRKFADIKKEIPKLEEGQSFDKLGWVNSLQDQSLTNAIEKEFKDKAKELIERKAEEKRKQEELIKNKAALDAQQAALEAKSGTVATPPPMTPEEVAKLMAEQGKLKAAYKLFISGTTPTQRPDEPQHIINSRQFLNNAKNFKNREKLSTILVTPNQEDGLGLTGLTAMSYGTVDSSDSRDVDNGFVAQVFVEQDGGKTYFVNKNGERIGEVGKPVDIQQVIFQAMPTTSLNDRSGKPRFRADQEADARAASAAWKVKREELFKAPAFPVKTYKFSISRGIPVINIVDGKYERNQVGEILIPEKKIATQQGLLQVVTQGNIAHNGENLKFNNGLTVLQYGDTLQILNNNTFGADKAASIYLAIKTMMDKFQSTKKLDPGIVSYLQNVLFWKKGAGTSGNQIFIDTATGQVSLGGKNYNIADLTNKKSEIIDQLKGTYHAINNTTLRDSFYEKFYEYKADGDNLTQVEWPNYQAYLLSKKGRSADQTPLVTTVAAPSDAKPWSFEQKYATLIDFELPVVQAPAPVEKAGAKDKSMLGEFVMDGETKNVFKGFKNGPVEFTGTIAPDGSISVEVIANDTIENAANNKELVNNMVIPTLKDLKKFDPTAEDIQSVTDFIAYKLAFELTALQPKAPVAEAPKVETSATFTPTTPYGTPTGPTVTTSTESQNIEAKKADIERRRADNLKDTGDPFDYVSSSPRADGKFNAFYTKTKESAVFDTYQEAVDWVNAKYDAELAALEGTKPAEGTYNPDETPDAETYRGLPVINTTNIKTATGKPGAAQYNRAENKILVNRELLKQKFDEKAWTNPRKQKDGSFATALPQDAFTTYEEFEKFVIEHEYQHSLLSFEESKAKTIGEYEDIINNRARGIEPPKTDIYNPEDTSAPDDEYMRVGIDSTPKLNDAQIEAFKSWVAKNVPGIPYEVLDNLVTTYDNAQAWGVFEKGVAKFYKGAPGTAPYHEVFEGIWKGFLSNDQKQAILDEFRNKKGKFVDRASGKKIDYAEATDLEAKERIADDFAEFRMGKLPARSLGEKVLKFFRAILDFFKSFVQKPSKKTELFNAINSGKFKEFTLPKGIELAAPEYMRIPGLTETQTFEFAQDMTARAAQYIFGDSKKSLYDLKEITGAEIFGKIKEAYIKEKKYEALGDDRYNKLIVRTKENLRTLGINFNEEDTIDINDENVTSRDYAPEPFSTDWKKTSPFAIKFVVSTLPQVEPMNQKNESSISLPKRIISSIKGYKLASFGKTFNTLLDKLSNTTSLTALNEKLVDLAKNDSTYVRLFQRIGGDLATGTIDFGKFKAEDWRLFINFFQTFTKQKPEAVIQYTDGSSVYTAPANQFTAAKLLQNEWFENMKVLADEKDSIIKRNKFEKTFIVDKGRLSGVVPKEPQGMVGFLSKLGIEFPIGTYNALTEKEKNDFTKAVGAIYTYIQKTPAIYTLQGKTLGINAPLSELSNLYIKATNPSQDTTYFGVEGQRIQSYAENNVASVMENEFNSVESVNDLKQLRPELNDVFAKNSVTLKSGGNFYNAEGERVGEIKVGYIQGSKIVDSNKGITTSKLSLGNRFTQEINQNLDGDYYILVPADGSTEWKINLGNHFTYVDIAAGRATGKINEIFRGYLTDEIALALDADNRSKLKNVGSKAKQLRFFKEILSEKDVNKIEEMIADGSTQEQIEKYVDDNIDSINSAVNTFIQSTAAETKNLLMNNNQIMQIAEGRFTYPGLQDKFANKYDINKFKMSEEDVNNLLMFVNANYIINNIELHKLFFGDSYEFAVKKGKLDETKRIKSFLSPRRTTFDSPEYNTYLNDEFNMAGDIQLSPEDPGYHLHKPFVNTVTLADVNLYSDTYPEVNEADAGSMIMDNTYREVKLKNGQWTTEAEKWHQWQMAYTRNAYAKKGVYKYTSEALKQQDLKLLNTPEPKFVTEVLKPIVSGVKAGETVIDNVLDKFSQMPLYYKHVEGTNLENLYTKMWKENIGYAVFESGRKVGITSTYSLYSGNGTLNTEPFNNMVKVPWKAYGIQVENAYENPKDQTRGSQLTKLSSLDLFENGEGSDKAKAAYERNLKALDALHENGYKNLLNKLGIEDLGDGFRLVDPKAVQESLEYELLRREMSENAKDTIKLNEDGQFIIPFEASPAYKQIKDILFSMVSEALVSPKMNGGPKVQVPVTGWENAGEGKGLALKTEDGYKKITKQEYEKLTEEEKKKVVLTSDTLKFYTKEDPYIEVLLPHWFRSKFNINKFPTDESILKYLNSTEEGKSILRGVGFRIPTQAMSSIETFKVKGFLPQSMGDVIVAPSEITAKAGSDFDIDKMNTYLKSVYVDKNGDIRLVKLQGSEEATKEFFAKVFDDTLKNKAIKKAEILEAVQILSLGLEDPKDLLGRYSNLLDVLLEDVKDSSEFEDKLMAELEQLGDTNLQNKLKAKYVDEMYNRALQNEYYESLEQLITLPENFERLISPVGDAGLPSVATELDKLRNQDEAKIPNKLLNRNYMTSLRNAFVTAKKWVGIAAVNITGQSLTQKSKVYIDPSRFELLSDFERSILGDGEIKLPHNTVEVDGVKYASLSGKKTANGKEFISDRLSGYATSFVDVAKDPYIMKIISSDSMVGVFMFLERMGVGENTIWFLNQPIIKKYVEYLDSIGKKGFFGKKDREYIRSMFPTTEDEIGRAAINPADFKNNIETYYEKGKFDNVSDNAVQQLIFTEFLKYAKMAEYSFKLTQATNYDTTKFRNSDEFSRKLNRTATARVRNIFSSVDKLLNSSFIGKQAKLIDKAMSSIGEIIKTERDDYSVITSEVIKQFEENEFLGGEEFNRIAGKIKSSFIDYIVQTQGGLNSQIKQLVVETSSVADQLVAAKKRHPEMKLLNELQVTSSDRAEGAKSVRLRANLKDAFEENMYVDMMRELKVVEPDLYNGLLKIAILQGSYQTAISIRNIMPIEDFAPLIKNIVETLTSTEQVKSFSKSGAFYRNNWKDDAIVPTTTPKFFLASEYPVGEEEFTEVELFQYYSPAFPNVDALNIKSTDRKVLLVSEIYNPDKVNNEFLKIPAVVTDPKTGEKIDMTDGITVTPKMFATKRAAGDFSLTATYGYKKVRYATGEPVVTAKGDHVYKLVNLHGDGQLLSEYYPDGRPSVVNNGTVKTNEISDVDLIKVFGNPAIIEKAVVPSQPKSKNVVEKTEPAGANEVTEITKDSKKTEFESTLNDGRKVTKVGYKLNFPEFPDVKIYITKSLVNEDGTTTEKGSWYVEEAIGSKMIPVQSWKLADIVQEVKDIININFKKASSRSILEQIGFKVSGEISVPTFENSFSKERQEEIIRNFSEKHKLTREQTLTYINEAIASKGVEVIDKLKECY